MFALALNLALLAVIVVGAIALERYVSLPVVRASIPQTVRAVLDLVAFGVFATLLFFVEVSLPIVDETIAALGVFAVLWLGLPLLAAQFLTLRDPEDVTANGCDR